MYKIAVSPFHSCGDSETGDIENDSFEAVRAKTMVQFNPEILNERVAPGIADFDSAAIPDLRQEFDQAAYWLSNHHLNTLFGPKYRDNWKQWNINLLFRAQAQFSFYHQARDATLEFLDKSSHHNPAVGVYFGAVSLWESAFLNYQIFLDLYCKSTDNTAFIAGDGSEEQRAYDIANSIKHWGSDIKKSRHAQQHTIPLWMSNLGFHTRTHFISYAEFSDITREIGKTADVLENPNAP